MSPRKGCKVLKVCTKCRRELPLDRFPVDKRGKDGHSTFCKDCRSEYYKNHYRLGKRTVDAYKTHCAKCGVTVPYVLTFHHKDPKTKSFELSISHTKISKVIKEIEKCICLCYNCHHTYHYFYGMNPDKPIETLEEYLKPDWTPPIKT